MTQLTISAIADTPNNGLKEASFQSPDGTTLFTAEIPADADIAIGELYDLRCSFDTDTYTWRLTLERI